MRTDKLKTTIRTESILRKQTSLTFFVTIAQVIRMILKNMV